MPDAAAELAARAAAAAVAAMAAEMEVVVMHVIVQPSGHNAKIFSLVVSIWRLTVRRGNMDAVKKRHPFPQLNGDQHERETHP
jgi:hypothetical protein